MASAWQESKPGASKSAKQPDRDAEIARVGGRQLRLVTTSQLVRIGLSRPSIQKRADRGRLFRLHRGVYAIHSPPFPRDQRYLAAVLACGDGALLCDLPAAAMQGFADTPNLLPQVSVPNGRGRSRPGIAVHRRAVVDPRDWGRFHGVPCTAPHLTLIDLAHNHTEAELKTPLVAAESKGLLKRCRLGELIAEGHGRPGIHKLERITAFEPARVRSKLELDFLPIWRDAGVPRPRVNFPIRVPSREQPLTVDFAWPELGMVVEADSQRFHGDWKRAETTGSGTSCWRWPAG